MRAGRALQSWIRATLLAVAAVISVLPAAAQDATWLSSPGSPDFNTDANWSTNAVPVGAMAFFGSSLVVDLSTSADTSLQGFTFSLGASAYTLSNANILEFTGAGIVINDGSLRITNDNTVIFSNGSSAGSARIINNGSLLFNDTSSAGNARILNNCCLIFSNASTAGNARIFNRDNLEFRDTSTAGSATIFNSFIGGIGFLGSSSADNATIINRGILEFLDTSTAGNATIHNRSSGEVDFAGSSTAGNANIINNGGIVFLENSSAGNATITNNCCMVFAGNSTAGAATITNNGSLAFMDSASAGSATITNNASLDFLGSSTAGNATIINNCCLTFALTSTAGNATIITQDGGHTFFFDNASGGAARFVVNSGGVLDISGLTMNGTTAGSIEGAGNIALGDKQLTVGSLGTSMIFSGVIDGLGGALVKVGGGSLTLSGVNAYTGPTTVDGGTLVVNGTLVSDVAVNAGASLMGTGQLASVTINSGGTHAPGNSIGTQTVTGSYSNSGTLVIEVNAAGQSDRVIVNGGVDITGATLRILEAAGAYGPTTQFLFLQNNGASPVIGNFAVIINGVPYLIPTVTTTGGDGNDIVLTLTRNDAALSDAARTPNQRAVAGALRNGFRSEAGSEGAGIINALLMPSPDGARAAFDQMSGEIHASIAHVLFSQSRQLTSMASERLWDVMPGGGATPAARDARMMSVGLASSQLGERMGLGLAEQRNGASGGGLRVATWVRGYGGLGSISADGNAERLESRTSGVMAGGDMVAAPGILVGAMGGWGTSGADVDRRSSTADIDSAHAGIYARAALGDLVLKAVGGYSHHDIDVVRHIAFASLLRTAISSYAADQATLYGEAGWRLRLGALEAMPWTGLQWSQVRVHGFIETGAGALDLASDGNSFRMLDAVAGVRVGTSVAAGGLTWVPQARVAWTHSFGDTDPQLDLAFTNGGAFLVSGVTSEPNFLTLGAGLSVLAGDAVYGFLDYAAHLADGSREHTATAGLRVRF